MQEEKKTTSEGNENQGAEFEPLMLPLAYVMNYEIYLMSDDNEDIEFCERIKREINMAIAKVQNTYPDRVRGLVLTNMWKTPDIQQIPLLDWEL